jgi:hypothetical protein
MPFKEIIAVYSKNHTTPIKVLCEKKHSYLIKRQVVLGFKEPSGKKN